MANVLTLAGSFFIRTIADVQVEESVGGTSVDLNVASTGSGIIDMDSPASPLHSLSTQAGAGDLEIRGGFNILTIGSNTNNNVRRINAKVVGTPIISGPCELDLDYQSNAGTVTLQGSGINGRIRYRNTSVSAVTPALTFTSLTDSVIVAELQSVGVNSKPYAMDAGTTRCILVLAGSKQASFSVVGTNAGTHNRILTEDDDSLVTTAIARAGRSGRFNGPPGEDGEEGPPGPPGPRGKRGLTGGTGAAGKKTVQTPPPEDPIWDDDGPFGADTRIPAPTKMPGAWQSYTPAIVQSAAVAATGITARFRVIGKTMHVQVDISANAVGTATAGIIVSLPALADSPGSWSPKNQVSNGIPYGTAVLALGGTVYHALAVFNQVAANVPYVGFFRTDTTGNQPVGQSAPTAALAVNDRMLFTVTYEVT